MTQTFANKLFDTLDKGLIYNKKTEFTLKQVEASNIADGKSIIDVNIDEDSLYFVDNNDTKKIHKFDLKTGSFAYDSKTTVNNITGGFAINGEDIFYSSTSTKAYLNETVIDNIYSVSNVNSNKEVCFNKAENFCYGSLNETLSSNIKTTSILLESSFNFNKKFITAIEYNGATQTSLLTIYNKNDVSQKSSPGNIEYTGSAMKVFCNDSVFGYYNSGKIYILPVADYEASTNKASLTWTQVADNLTLSGVYITNEYFTGFNGKNIYYAPVEWLYYPEHSITTIKTQMDVLFSIDRKLDILQGILKQLTPTI